MVWRPVGPAANSPWLRQRMTSYLRWVASMQLEVPPVRESDPVGGQVIDVAPVQFGAPLARVRPSLPPHELRLVLRGSGAEGLAT